jgi:hypothetical protein
MEHCHLLKYRGFVARVVFLLSWTALPVLNACSEPPPLKLTLQQRDMVDTIYLQKVQTLGPQLDSLCLVNRETRLKNAVDSILAIRRSEEEKLRTKYNVKK